MKTYPTVIRFGATSFGHIVEQTAAQRGAGEPVLDAQAVERALSEFHGWPAYERRALARHWATQQAQP